MMNSNRKFLAELYDIADVCEVMLKTMPRIEEHGKDKVIFMSEEELSEAPSISIPEPEPQPGLILADGSINWNCPCLGGMATGPCGVQFRQAFSCFHYSTAEPKGSNCVEDFTKMQSCMQKYPTLYGSSRDEDDSRLDLDEVNNSAPGGSQSKDTGQKEDSKPDSK